MDKTIFTQRLKLILLTAVERGSQEFDWIHELRTDKQTTSWSIYGASKSVEDTEKILKVMFPKDAVEKFYSISYSVHEILQESNAATSTDPPTRSIGFISLRSIPLDETTSLPRLGFASTATTLSLEVAYMFLPTAWGRGYATESIKAMFDACQKVDRGFWAPHKNLCVRAIVNNENKPSQRVMEKCGMGAPRVLEFKGDRFWINGKWIEEHCLFIYEKMLVE